MICARAPALWLARPVRVPVAAAAPRAFSVSSASVARSDARPRQQITLRRPAGSPRHPLPASPPRRTTRTRATLDGKEDGKDDSDDEAFVPEPDAAAFANLLVCGACVALLGYFSGVDPWATLLPDSPSATARAVGLGLAASPFYISFLLLARSLACGGELWWSEVEGQGELSRLPALRALGWAFAVAMADGAAMRGLVLPWVSRLVTAPAGVDLAEVARKAAAAELPDVDSLLKPAAEAASNAAAAAVAGGATIASTSGALLAAGLGAPVAPFPLPVSWLLPVVALAAGAATAALASFEPSAGLRVGFTAKPDEETAELLKKEQDRGQQKASEGGEKGKGEEEQGKEQPPMIYNAGFELYDKAPDGPNASYTMREILWAYWGDNDGAGEEDEEEEGAKGDGKEGEKGAKKEAAAAARAAKAAKAAEAEAEDAAAAKRAADAAAEFSFGDLLSNPWGSLGKLVAPAITETELVDALARSVETGTRLFGAVNSLTGGAAFPGVELATEDAADERALRQLVAEFIAAWREKRRGQEAADAGTAFGALMASSELEERVFLRVRERRRQEEEEKKGKKVWRRGGLFAWWDDGSGSEEEGSGEGEKGSKRNSGSSGVVRRWPKVDGPLRQWKVPLLVGVEGTALAALALASHSALAAAVAQGVGLFSLALVERKEKEKKEGRGGGGGTSA